MTHRTSASAGAARFGGSLIVAIDLSDAILMAVMAVEDALLFGLISEAALAELDGALDGALTGALTAAPDSAARLAQMDEDAYLDWLAEKWGYTDGDVQRDTLMCHARQA